MSTNWSSSITSFMWLLDNTIKSLSHLTIAKRSGVVYQCGMRFMIRWLSFSTIHSSDGRTNCWCIDVTGAKNVRWECRGVTLTFAGSKVLTGMTSLAKDLAVYVQSSSCSCSSCSSSSSTSSSSSSSSSPSPPPLPPPLSPHLPILRGVSYPVPYISVPSYLSHSISLHTVWDCRVSHPVPFHAVWLCDVKALETFIWSKRRYTTSDGWASHHPSANRSNESSNSDEMDYPLWHLLRILRHISLAVYISRHALDRPLTTVNKGNNAQLRSESETTRVASLMTHR